MSLLIITNSGITGYSLRRYAQISPIFVDELLIVNTRLNQKQQLLQSGPSIRQSPHYLLIL